MLQNKMPWDLHVFLERLQTSLTKKLFILQNWSTHSWKLIVNMFAIGFFFPEKNSFWEHKCFSGKKGNAPLSFKYCICTGNFQQTCKTELMPFHNAALEYLKSPAVKGLNVDIKINYYCATFFIHVIQIRNCSSLENLWLTWWQTTPNNQQYR